MCLPAVRFAAHRDAARRHTVCTGLPAPSLCCPWAWQLSVNYPCERRQQDTPHPQPTPTPPHRTNLRPTPGPWPVMPRWGPLIPVCQRPAPRGPPACLWSSAGPVDRAFCFVTSTDAEAESGVLLPICPSATGESVAASIYHL